MSKFTSASSLPIWHKQKEVLLRMQSLVTKIRSDLVSVRSGLLDAKAAEAGPERPRTAAVDPHVGQTPGAAPAKDVRG